MAKLSNLLTIGPNPRLKIGVNYPWWGDKYGIFLGDSSLPWEADLERTLTDLGTIGIKLIRVFMLANLAVYGTVSGSGKTAVFTPPAACPPQYIDGTTRLLKILEKTGARAILSLVDFGAFCTEKLGCTSRQAIVIDPVLRTKFFDDVFEPMLAASAPFKKQILAWEVMNEPRWATNSMFLNAFSSFGPVATMEQIVAFLKDGLARIEAHDFKSSVGHALSDDLSIYPVGTMPQFHYYPDDEDAMPSRGVTKAFVGEFSSRFADAGFPMEVGKYIRRSVFGDPDALGRAWPDLNGDDKKSTKVAIFERLKLMDSLGYRYALLWPIDTTTTDGTTRLLPGAREAIQEFLALTI